VRAWAAACAAACAIALAAPARGDEGTDALFHRGVAALQREAWGEAIDAFEALSDRGVVHPDASYDRALAYLGRVRARSDRPGDLGRAAAALEETLAARPGDADAESALEAVRSEVARRRARGEAGAEVESRPTLERALVGLARESTWALLAAAASAVLAVGLVLRRLARDTPGHLAGSIATPIGAAALALFAALAGGAAWLRRTTEDAVVVVPEVRLLDAEGAPIAGATIPEAARVELGDRKGSLVHLRWGVLAGFAPLGSVRVVPRP
jgi:hypothetical protein